MENTVTITAKEYARLQTRREQLDMFLSVLINTASLNWSKTGLAMDDKTVDLFLSVICPEARMDRIEELQREEEQKRGAEDA